MQIKKDHRLIMHNSDHDSEAEHTENINKIEMYARNKFSLTYKEGDERNTDKD